MCGQRENRGLTALPKSKPTAGLRPSENSSQTPAADYKQLYHQRMSQSEGKPWPFDRDTDREDWLRWTIAFTFIIAILLYRYGLLQNRPKTAPKDGSQLS